MADYEALHYDKDKLRQACEDTHTATAYDIKERVLNIFHFFYFICIVAVAEYNAFRECG